MAGWYNSVVEDLGKIVDSIDHYEKELEEAKYECSIKAVSYTHLRAHET